MIPWILGIIYGHNQQDLSKNQVPNHINIWLTASKQTGYLQSKRGGEIKMVLFYLLQQNTTVELHMIKMLKPFPLQLSKTGAAS